jgi:hypothetical protein
MVAALTACADPGSFIESPNTNSDSNSETCTNGKMRCYGNFYQECIYGKFKTQETCGGETPYCYDSIGCVKCTPGHNYCDGSSVMKCDETGLGGQLHKACSGAEICQQGNCISACKIAEQKKSYIGCDYWPTSTANALLDSAFDNNFGVVVHNQNAAAAEIIIELNGSQVRSKMVSANTIEVFELPFVKSLKMTSDTFASKSVPGGAYHLTSSLPVTVYQFSPLDYQKGATYSYTNDASLLLPSHVFSENYLVMSRSTFGIKQDAFTWAWVPGFFSVVGTQDGTQVTVDYSANTEGGELSAESKGATQTYTVDRGEVLQVLSKRPTSCTGALDSTGTYCDSGNDYDLTGTSIKATAPIGLFSGHVCSNVPFNYPACDHLEEQMMPLETWGKDFLVGRTKPQASAFFGVAAEPNVIRIVSGADGNVIKVKPAQPKVGSGLTLNKGQWMEFESTESFRVTASGPLMVGQFLVGQNMYSDGWGGVGDPSYSLIVPTEQFRDQYTFLAPSTITQNYVNVTRRFDFDDKSAPIFLDGKEIADSEFSTPIGSSGYSVAQVAISGTHHAIESKDAFGIVVYGFAEFTSYSYPGGLNLEYINPVK